jgi:hypothetical protein
MSDEKRSEGSRSGGKQAAATEIAYCPHLQIYHYLRVDGVDQIFDSSQLERAIETFQKQGDSRQAEFMAILTGFARQFPHQVVSFDDQGKLNLRELLAAVVHTDLDEGHGPEGHGPEGRGPEGRGPEGHGPEGRMEGQSSRLQLVGSETEKDPGSHAVGHTEGSGSDGK